MSEEEKTNSEVGGSVPNQYSESGIDFSGVSALGNSDYKKESAFKSFMNGLLEGLLKLLLFLFGFLLDIIKAVWTIISGIFIYLFKAIRGVVLYFRHLSRIFREVDAWGKWSFLCQGLGNLKNGQIVNGVVFMAVEVAFIAFLAIAGIPNIINLGNLDYLYQLGFQGDAPTRLVLGIIAIAVIVGYLVVYHLGIHSMYDCYQIVHELDFRKAHEDAVDVLNNLGSFEDDLTKCGHAKVYKLMYKKYGYTRLSALYISYVDFKKVPERKPNIFIRAIDGIKGGIHKGYLKWAKKVKAGKWSNVFADFLNWELVKRKPTTGIDAVKNAEEIKLLRFRHTYDKYNDYHATVRDTQALLKCLADPKGMLDAAYADDAVSKRNAIAPIDHKKAPKAKELLSRIVGLFEVSLEVGRAASKILAEILKKHTSDEERLKQIQLAYEKEKILYDEFIAANRDGAKACAQGMLDCLSAMPENLSFFEQGKKAFLPHVKSTYHIDDYHAVVLYDAYRRATRLHNNEQDRIAYLAQVKTRFEPMAKLMDEYAFHGQVMKFKKQAKQYLDEKFAVTVLALPTLGALLTTVLPLIFSIVIAFTNWDSAHIAKNFVWDMSAWGKVFAMGSEGDNFLIIFGTLLRWTIVWAFLATFTNYIAGIVLALMINKKGIKAKGLFRTCFVLTIAIPQFITLLVISLLLSPDGVINSWLREQGAASIPFLGKITNGTSLFELDSNYTFIKMMIVIINMWVGIPYTMLSTSGILMNIPADLYESAQIDGANAWTQFWKITMPYIIFVTGPSLLTTFIGNINNFNIIYLLTAGEPGMGDQLTGNIYYAGHTDLLITWLYKLTANPQNGKPEYAMGSVIGILMFAICAFFSLIMYKRMGSVKNEEAFQ